MGETSKGEAAGGSSSSSSSILPFLPRMSIFESGILQWPPQISYALKSLVRGPAVSEVADGEALGDCINDLREQSLLPALSSAAVHGFSLYFDDLIPRAASGRFFENTLPCMADLALRLPNLLNDHFGNAKRTSTNADTNLRILHPQQAGLVFLSQELVAALLACAFFCLYPPTGRGENKLPYFNFDKLYRGITSIVPSQEQKVHCILHYFTRVCEKMPQGIISYERKVLPRHTESGILSPISEPNENYWNSSQVPLCSMQVFEKGNIEDQTSDALEVDFANRYLGGGILSQGCVQEEIRFVISPELIAGMLFMSAMDDNESIEIRGTERFSSYDGYGSNFYFTGDYTDNKPQDILGRRKTRIVAIDALVNPSKKQFRSTLMLRETNKAFCGFLDHAEYYALDGLGDKEHPEREKSMLQNLAAKTVKDEFEGQQKAEWTESVHDGPLVVDAHVLAGESTLGIATGNWGCGAFGGDVELKSLLQWIAASQAGRPFLHYYSFGGSYGSKLQQLADWTINEKWCVGELWGILVEYGQKRLNAECCQGLFEWILPLTSKDAPKSSLTDTTQQPVLHE